jgi:hypothetical protein
MARKDGLSGEEAARLLPSAMKQISLINKVLDDNTYTYETRIAFTRQRLRNINRLLGSLQSDLFGSPIKKLADPYAENEARLQRLKSLGIEPIDPWYPD